ncbi:MAG: GMC oxidoreductase [Pseudonocardiaceae bacterium]
MAPKTAQPGQRPTTPTALAGEIAASDPFAKWCAREALPGADITGEAGLRHYVARGTGTYYHPVGSCAMGTGPDAVVRPDLRVRGLDGLRVADASVMPTIVCVNTNAATIMIVETRIALFALEELADRVAAALAGRAGKDSLAAFADAYRDYA